MEHCLSNCDLGGISALPAAEDAVANLVLGRLGGGRRGQDDAGELGTGDPREGGLKLVLAGNLEEVEEVGCGGVYGDEVLA